MTVSASDIILVLSGGISNTNPDQSLGGPASLFPISSNINNLFSDVSASQATSGYVDYRCIYVINNNATDSFYNVSVSLQGQVSGGSSIDFGVLSRDETQEITINGSPTGGYIVLGYEGAFSPHILWDNNPAIFAQNIQNGLNSTTGLSTVVCTQGGTSSEFIVQFVNADGDRNQNLLTIHTNAFTPAVSDPSIITITDGGPRNDVAATIGSATVAPNGVVFTDNSITINTLRPEEGFPLWFRRTTSSGSSAIANDGFLLSIQGTVFP